MRAARPRRLTLGSHGCIHPLYHISLRLYLVLSQTAEQRTEDHRNTEREGKPKSERVFQKPQRGNSKQLEHHLRHQCPTGSAKRDLGRFLLLLSLFGFSVRCGHPCASSKPSYTICDQKKKKKHSLNVVFMFPGERTVTIAMATPHSTKHKLIFTTAHKAVWMTLPSTSSFSDNCS